ncbi:hypothetical protein HAX54_044744, partial [Datura stramonium]|nr:hypothetical protein [Datura stramonium]
MGIICPSRRPGPGQSPQRLKLRWNLSRMTSQTFTFRLTFVIGGHSPFPMDPYFPEL